jgi:CHRD domain-containing protein
VKKLVLVALLGVLVTAVAGGSYAVAKQGGNDRGSRFSARMDGWNEIPSVVSTGEGRFRARLVNPTTLEYELEYSGLETPSLFAHIHIGGRFENGGVSAFLCGGGSKPDPCPPTAGTVTGTIVPADVVGPASQGVLPGEFDDLLLAMRRGEAYANVHSERSPGGEIRGQIRRGGGHGGGHGND